MSGRPLGAVETKTLDLETLAKAHSYVLFNCNKVDEFITEHLRIVRDQNRRLREHELQRIHCETFALWFQNHVEELHTLGDQRITEELRALAGGPIEIQINSKPKRVHVDQWKNLIKNWNKEEAKKISERNKTNRAYKKMMQITGKRSYARVREELKRVSDEKDLERRHNEVWIGSYKLRVFIANRNVSRKQEDDTTLNSNALETGEWD
ncbi:hypothetical protein L6452_05442 [Arctium lappa]|uniref:Uncharacterized protein n=1 Tax=Arctium lappa TaxID=4217 RepID=A0ACB9EFU7_ARCLA|nr:hypothetical protein L6452_05442 [Arctium lappa]